MTYVLRLYLISIVLLLLIYFETELENSEEVKLIETEKQKYSGEFWNNFFEEIREMYPRFLNLC